MASISTAPFFEKQKIDLGFGEVSKRDFKEMKRIKISDLMPNQKLVEDWLIDKKRKGNGLTIPYVLVFRGNLVLMDGHHTTIAKKMNGQKYIYALTLTIN